MENSHPISVSSFYRFQVLPEAELESLRLKLLEKGETLDLYGLLLLGTEGFNATVAGLNAAIAEYKVFVQELFGGESIFFKDSPAFKNPFRQMRVKIREEIVTLGRPDLAPFQKSDSHLSPAEWHQWLQREDVQVIDTRNGYEVELGKFKQAVDFNIEEFQSFPTELAKSNIKKDKPVLIYCTGGIRCEKAILEMQEQGFSEVKQLEGGIINYLAEFPEGDFEGECFVFDHRVAVDQELKPSKRFTLCPHCGQPAEQWIDCKQCRTKERVCHRCLSKEAKFETCSKNCAHHFLHGHKTTKIHLDERKKRGQI